MRILLITSLVLSAAIHFLPLSGALGSEALASLYGVRIADANLEILMRHRAVLFGILGALLLYAVFDPKLRTAAILAGLSSAGAFLGIALQVGGHNLLLERVVRADIIVLFCLLVAGFLHLRSTRALSLPEDRT